MTGREPVVVLTNPAAGGRRRQHLLPEVLRRLGAAGQELAVIAVEGAAASERACRERVERGAAALVAVGGDGTVHTALPAVAGTGVPFSVVPAGSGNDFATAAGIPADPLVAAERIAAALPAGITRPIDLAQVSGADGTHRWYAAVLGAGFDALVNERANRMRWPRGDRRYDVAILRELVGLRPRRYRIGLDGRGFEIDAVLVAVGNTATYGGGIRICPQADSADGVLDVVIGRHMGRVTLARLWPRAYRGTHVAHPLVDSYRAGTVELSAEGVVAYADGERCLPLPVVITCVPGALRLMVT
jgi:diacylglycerol kinase (ATP)